MVDLADPDVQRTIRIVLVPLATFLLVSPAYWTYRDASARGSSRPVEWAIATLVFSVGVLPYYLTKRREIGPRSSHTRTDRVLATALVAIISAFVLAASFAPPDPFSQLRSAVILFCALAPLVYVLLYRGGVDRLRKAI